ncbi:hypothetical protein ACE6H2_010641 [Prunus campanulata]
MLKYMKVYALDNEIKTSLKGFKVDDWFAESTDYRVFRYEYVRYEHYPSVAANVIASTAAELLDMISGLNFLLFTKCMIARSIIRDLLEERCTKHNNDRHAGKEIDDGEDENQIDDEDGELSDNKNNEFENSSKEGENSTENDNEENE